MPLTAEVAFLALAVARLSRLSADDTRTFGALRDSHSGSGQKG